ncbi:Asp-tRNA(Asn)/Glu-tRNA(Gln) amidotransferase subunit GatC [Lactobacillus terrae]|uniref:Asp-tRNA(Asn)/Glu-tRNA(Gln) amidotransferase subunit GatC n=1 Tax=Lactobacillus terrae TaxID=2269374 RepID=UPI000C1B6420|nr:Asp-tRNA(Asn)/Glu-tRNA(Gln) amidotransferase subunit GatC [Lactobacillus terrae]
MLSKEEILHVAELANLELDDAEVDGFVTQIGQIVEMEDKLASVDTTGVEPTYSMGDRLTVFREDEGKHDQTVEQLLSNVPETKDNLIKVPSILGNGEKE